MNFLKSFLLSRGTKMELYRTLVRPLITYGAETWILNSADENAVQVFERKII
jgi:hypothetical protein